MNRTKTSQFAGAGNSSRDQHGALCWRMHRGKVQVLLITSRDTGRWVIPKGWPVTGLDGAGSAGREAWEEAGVTGEMSAEPLGYYGYDKVLDPAACLPCMVTVHALRVARLAERFPERAERRRKWFDAAKAARKVAEPELRALLARVAEAPDLLSAAKEALADRQETAPGKTGPERGTT